MNQKQLIVGFDKDNYRELEDELYPYELEDLLNLKIFHSLNLIRYEKGWSKFITKLPTPNKYNCKQIANI